MTSLNHRLNPLFSIKECMSCGALYTRNCGCSKGSLEDKILVPKPPQNCATGGDPVNVLYCRSCAFVRKCLNEGWYTIHDGNTSESSNHNTNVSCGNGAHIGYNCPPKAPIISNPEQCNQTINELPQTLPSVHPTCNSGDENSFTYNSKPNFVENSPNIFNHPPQPPMYSCEFCGNDARYGHYSEERFLKIKQVMREEQNQPEVMQELLLKLMDDLQILKGSQQEKKETATQDALMDKQYRYEDIQELISKLLEDVRNISEELSEYINCPSWNRTIFYDNKDDEYTLIYSKPKAITPDLSIKEPDNSLSIGDKHLDTIPSIEKLVPIPSEFKGISEDTCDVPVCEDPSTFDALSNHYEILSDSNNDDTSSDDDSYENIEYMEALPLNLEYDSLEEVNEDQEEKDFDLEDIFQIQDVILREKLLNISRLVTNIKSLKDNPTLDRVLKSPSSFPIPVVDSDSFFEEFDTSLSYSDNSLPEFESFSDHTEETRRLISIVIFDNSNDLLLELPEFESFHFDLYDDPLFPRPPPEPPDVEISLIVETDAPVINNVDELNEDDDSFTFVIWTFLPFLTYPEVSPLLSSTKNEDTIFDPDIST
ncbi:hypothetical protein Tco_0476091 [Tanacetum coccineum]